MQNQLDQILGTDFRGWADVISFQFFLRLLSQTPTESHGLGVERCKPRFCERELRRSCDWELIPLRFLMRRKREFSDEKPEREWRTKRKGGKGKKVIFFYSTGYYSKGEYCLELLQFLLQCSLLQRCYCSHSKRNRVWWSFWSAFFVCLLSKVRASWRCFKNHTDGALM